MDSGDAHLPQDPHPHASTRSTGLIVGLGLLLVVALVLIGAPNLDAPPLPAEQAAIIDNPLVQAADIPAAAQALVDIDTYPGLTTLSYAAQRAAGATTISAYRTLDIALHIVNALLLWAVAYVLLGTGNTVLPRPTRVLVGWCAAAVWSILPTHAGAYAAPLGRAEVLAGASALTALLLLALGATRRNVPLLIASVCCCVVALLTQALWLLPPALLLVALALLPVSRIATVSYGALSVLALLCGSYWLVHQDLGFTAGLARSAQQAWSITRNVVFPADLAVWYPPAAVGGALATWAGAALFVVSAGVLAYALRQPQRRLYAALLAWFWLLLISATMFASDPDTLADRNAYLATTAFPLLAMVFLARHLARAAPEARKPVVTATLLLTVLFAGAFGLRTAGAAADMRDSIARFNGLVDRLPRDPTLRELMARAYADRADWLIRNTDDAEAAQAALEQARSESFAAAQFAVNEVSPLTYAERMQLLGRLAAFNLDIGAVDFAVELALHVLRNPGPRTNGGQSPGAEHLTAASLTPVARVLAGVGESNLALVAYTRLLAVMPADDPTRGLRILEYADLLLFSFNRPDAAVDAYREALQHPLPTKLSLIARTHLALAEIRGGLGERGYVLLSELNADHPNLLETQLGIGEYHLRSHNWPDAEAAYQKLLDAEPLNLFALRGHYETAAQLDYWHAARERFQAAIAAGGATREVVSFLAWTAMLANDPDAREIVKQVRRTEPTNPLACLALSVDALRGDDLEEALEWYFAARAGESLPESKVFPRAASAFLLQRQRADLPPASLVVEAAIRLELGQIDQAYDLLVEYDPQTAREWLNELACRIASE